jgi:hypothetical protein
VRLLERGVKGSATPPWNGKFSGQPRGAFALPALHVLPESVLGCVEPLDAPTRLERRDRRRALRLLTSSIEVPALGSSVPETGVEFAIDDWVT